MVNCVNIERTKTQICSGSLNRKIGIYTREISAPTNPGGDDIDFGEEFLLLYEVWSMIQTPKGKTIFDDVGIERVIDTVFYIRYKSDLTSENWVEYSDNRYDIMNIINLEDNNLFLQLNCQTTGSTDKEASKT